MLSFLPMKAAGKTCILSKRWYYVWETYPIIELHHDSFGLKGEGVHWGRVVDKTTYSIYRAVSKRLVEIYKWRDQYGLYRETLERFEETVENRLHKFCEHESEIQKFILSIPILGLRYFHVHKWLQLVGEKQVKELDLKVTDGNLDWSRDTNFASLTGVGFVLKRS